MSQLLALLNKNWILCKRNKLGSVLQIILPILFLLFTMLTRNLAQINTYAAQSNLSNNSLVFNFYGDPIAAASTLSVSTPTFLKYISPHSLGIVQIRLLLQYLLVTVQLMSFKPYQLGQGILFRNMLMMLKLMLLLEILDMGQPTH